MLIAVLCGLRGRRRAIYWPDDLTRIHIGLLDAVISKTHVMVKWELESMLADLRREPLCGFHTCNSERA